jgi:hypothetical protein
MEETNKTPQACVMDAPDWSCQQSSQEEIVDGRTGETSPWNDPSADFLSLYHDKYLLLCC